MYVKPSILESLREVLLWLVKIATIKANSDITVVFEKKRVDSFIMSKALRKFENALENANHAMIFNRNPKYHNPSHVEEHLKNVTIEMNTLNALVAKRESEAEERKQREGSFFSYETQNGINIEHKITRFITMYKPLIAALSSNNKYGGKKYDDIMRQQWERKKCTVYDIFSRGRKVDQQIKTHELKEWYKVTPISKRPWITDPDVPEPTSTVCHRSISVKAMITSKKFKH